MHGYSRIKLKGQTDLFMTLDCALAECKWYVSLLKYVIQR